MPSRQNHFLHRVARTLYVRLWAGISCLDSRTYNVRATHSLGVRIRHRTYAIGHLGLSALTTVTRPFGAERHHLRKHWISFHGFSTLWPLPKLVSDSREKAGILLNEDSTVSRRSK